MGSYASSQTQSKTNYSNLPVTLADNANAITGAGSDGSQIGGYANQNVAGGLGNISGSRFSDNHAMNLSNGGVYSVLDGGVINQAFDFGSNLVGIMADLTKQNNNAAQAQTGQALQAAAAVGTAAAGVEQAGIAGTIENNKTLIYAAVAAAVAYFVFFRKK